MRQAQRFVQGHIAHRKRVGPAQRPHRDVLRRPGPDTLNRLQVLQRRFQRRAGCELQPIPRDGPRHANNCGLSLPHQPDRTQCPGR